MHDNWLTHDTDNEEQETERNTTDRVRRRMGDAEIRQRILDRYDVDELLEILEVSLDDVLDGLWSLVLEHLDELDIYE